MKLIISKIINFVFYNIKKKTNIIRNKPIKEQNIYFLGGLESKRMELFVAYGRLSKWFNEIIKSNIYVVSRLEHFTIVACEMYIC